MRRFLRLLLVAAVVVVPMFLVSPKKAEARRGVYYRPGVPTYHYHNPYYARPYAPGPYRTPYGWGTYYGRWYGPRSYYPYYGPRVGVRVGPLGAYVY